MTTRKQYELFQDHYGQWRRLVRAPQGKTSRSTVYHAGSWKELVAYVDGLLDGMARSAS